jgi:hypothetical protein
LSSSLLDYTFDGSLGFGMTSVGSRSDLRNTSGRRFITRSECVVSSVMFWCGVGGISDAEEGKKGGEESKTVGEHFECLCAVVKK